MLLCETDNYTGVNNRFYFLQVITSFKDPNDCF